MAGKFSQFTQLSSVANINFGPCFCVNDTILVHCNECSSMQKQISVTDAIVEMAYSQLLWLNYRHSILLVMWSQPVGPALEIK